MMAILLQLWTRCNESSKAPGLRNLDEQLLGVDLLLLYLFETFVL